jgi:hypothetical protein
MDWVEHVLWRVGSYIDFFARTCSRPMSLNGREFDHETDQVAGTDSASRIYPHGFFFKTLVATNKVIIDTNYYMKKYSPALIGNFRQQFQRYSKF